MKGFRNSLMGISISALASLILTTSAAPRASTRQRPADLIHLTVTVMDNKGRVLTDIDKEAFTVYDGKTPVDIVDFSNADAPLSVGILLDLSGSIKEGRFNKVEAGKRGVLRFLQQSNPANEYFVLCFAARSRLLLDWTRDAKSVENAVSNLDNSTLKGETHETALYDACYLGVEKLKQGSNAKRVMILYTDGMDSYSRYKFSDLRMLLKESDIQVCSVVIAEGISILAGYSIKPLSELSSISGGDIFTPVNPAMIADAFDFIALQLRHQYSISFKPAARDGKWHKISVKVKRAPHVRTREGYYAPAR